jgi:hypothetical protein
MGLKTLEKVLFALSVYNIRVVEQLLVPMHTPGGGSEAGNSSGDSVKPGNRHVTPSRYLFQHSDYGGRRTRKAKVWRAGTSVKDTSATACSRPSRCRNLLCNDDPELD